MPESTVFLSKLAGGAPTEAKEQFLRMVKEQIMQFTGLKISVTLAESASSPHVVIAMYDIGNQEVLKMAAMGSAIRIKTIGFFLQHSLILMPSDISITFSGTTKI